MRRLQIMLAATALGLVTLGCSKTGDAQAHLQNALVSLQKNDAETSKVPGTVEGSYTADQQKEYTAFRERKRKYLQVAETECKLVDIQALDGIAPGLSKEFPHLLEGIDLCLTSMNSSDALLAHKKYVMGNDLYTRFILWCQENRVQLKGIPKYP